MNTMLRICLLCAFALSFCSFISCSSDEDITTPTPTNTVEVTFTVNGGEYSNKTFVINGSGAAVYDPNENLTGITFAGKEGSKNISCTIGWAGSSTGTRNWAVFDEHDSASVGFLDDTHMYGCEQGTLTITEFGSVGGFVKGTFSGSFTLFLSNQKVQVSNGKFAVKRVI